MPVSDFFIVAVVSIFAGLDRTAALQVMLSRPIVVAPLTGVLLGDALIGLEVGALVELLWLGRLPVGAAIPPDDTQVAIGGTLLAIAVAPVFGMTGPGAAVVCTLAALVPGKIGKIFERSARERNGRLMHRAERALEGGDVNALEGLHLRGMLHFALASLVSFALIVLCGALLLVGLLPLLQSELVRSEHWLSLLFPFVGTAVIVGTININRSMTLFVASFVMALLLLWIL